MIAFIIGEVSAEMAFGARIDIEPHFFGGTALTVFRRAVDVVSPAGQRPDFIDRAALVIAEENAASFVDGYRLINAVVRVLFLVHEHITLDFPAFGGEMLAYGLEFRMAGKHRLVTAETATRPAADGFRGVFLGVFDEEERGLIGHGVARFRESRERELVLLFKLFDDGFRSFQNEMSCLFGSSDFHRLILPSLIGALDVTQLD